MADYSWLIEDIETLSAYTADEYTRRVLKHAADAIEQLQKSTCPYYIRNVHDSGDDSLCDKHKCEANALPRWIPVTERLPEKVKASYLCRTDGEYHCEVRWTDNVYGLWTGGSGKWGWSIFDIPQYSKVTHWMPLPEPPKEETE